MKKQLLLCATLLVAVWSNAQKITTQGTPSKYIMACDEYRPAPGQFINQLPKYEEKDTEKEMVDKCTASIANNERVLISLGAYGGYVTFHFDHSIANIKGQRDFYIMGNAFQANATQTSGGSSEPGIVMVSHDANNNGLPDDAWYELSGSCDVDSVGKVIYGYECTYKKAPMQNVPWTDNKGNSGVVDRNQFHSQEYYPLWIEDEYVLKGSRLPRNGWDESGNGSYWVQHFFREGYVDNKPNTDTLANSFDIDWAVDPLTRKPVKIEFVDFVRVYNGVQQMCGWLGETSTEVMGAEDLHLDASIEAIKNATSGIGSTRTDLYDEIVAVYSIDGKLLITPQKGLNIIKYKSGKTVKQIIK